jgi:hypothetical protein
MLKIREGQILSTDKNVVVLYLKENKHVDIWEHPSKLIPKLKIDFKHIKDLQGRGLNVVTYIPVNQFRELFVQKLNTGVLPLYDTASFVAHDKPLQQNEVQSIDLEKKVTG